MGRTPRSQQHSQPPLHQNQNPPSASIYRVVLEAPRGTSPFGSLINDASLLLALNEFGPVFHLEVKSSIVFATFKSTATVETLVAKKSLTINGVVCSTRNLVFNTTTALGAEDKDEHRLHELFSKQSMKPANLVIKETRDVSQVIPPGTDIEWRIQVTNRSTQARELLSIEMPQQRQKNFILRSPVLTHRLQMPTIKKPIKVGPNGTHTQGIKFVTQRHEQGVFRHTLLLNFSNFIYEHILVVNVSTPKAAEDLELLKPQSEFVPPTLPAAVVPELRVVPAFTVGRDGKLDGDSKIPGAHLYLSNSEYSGERELKPYPVPSNIHGMIEGRKSASFNPWKVRNNWRTRLHELLFLEEAQQAKLTRAYDLRAVEMEQVTSYVEGEKTLYLPAPMTRVHCANLAEKRPSVQRADRVFAWVAGGGAQQQFEGYVHRVEGEALVLIFCEDFHARHPSGTKMNMRFDVDRLSTRLMHRAVDDTLLDVVWPAQLSAASAETDAQLAEVVRSTSLPKELNELQRRVIAQLTMRTHGSAPYLLVGPFGTGKTRTLIEFLRRLVSQKQPGPHAARVLVCSPSNSSVDKYVAALQDLLGPDQMLRVQAPHRSRVDAAIGKYSHQDKITGAYCLPGRAALLKMVVVVSTTRSAAMLVNANVHQGHFTHIIVDEAAQLMEAEALLPISLAGPNTAVVMAGDPQQLGPSTFSKVDSVHGLHCSIMERLMSMPAYSIHTSAKRACCKLIKNYRSHPDLVRMLSRISYGNSLEAHAPTEKVTALQNWAKAGTERTFPMLFVSLEGGSEEREGDSPSWFNRQEAHVLQGLVADLMRSCEAQGLTQEDVGIITPYFKQSQKLRVLLRSNGLSRVRVGSTEEFHGHEIKALFISTVRTSVANLELDEIFDTGFVGNSKRFNTALSRAVALAVVVGDLNVLARSAEWRDMLGVCRERKCFVTQQAPPLPGMPAPAARQKGGRVADDQATAAQMPSLPTKAHDMHALLGSMGTGQAMPAMPTNAVDEQSILRGASTGAPEPQLALAPGFADEADEKADEAVDDEDDEDEEPTPAWVEEPSSTAAEGEDLLPPTLVQPPAAIEAGRADFLSSRGQAGLNAGSQPVGRTASGGASRAPVGPSNGFVGQAVPQPAHMAPVAPAGRAVPMPSMGSGVADPQSMYSPATHPTAPPYANGCCSGFGLPVGASAVAAHPQQHHGNGAASMYSATMYEAQTLAAAAEHEVQLYAHGGAGLLFVRGTQTAPYAVHEEADGIKIVISLFNLEYELVPKMKSFDVVLRPSEDVLKRTASSHSCVHGLTPAETRLIVRVTDAFDPAAVQIDYDEHKETLNLTLVKKKAENAPIRLLVNRVKHS